MINPTHFTAQRPKNGLIGHRGLAGEDIPLEARVMSLADMYDALLSERPYKKAWTHQEAIQEIIARRNTQFDPLVVDAFIAEQDAFKDIATKMKD